MFYFKVIFIKIYVIILGVEKLNGQCANLLSSRFQVRIPALVDNYLCCFISRESKPRSGDPPEANHG